MGDRDEEEFSSADEGDFGGRQPAGGRQEDDFDNDFDDSGAFGGGGGPADTMRSTAVANQPFDEAVELSDDEGEQPSPAVPRSDVAGEGTAPVANQPFDEAVELSSEDSVDDEGDQGRPIARPAGGGEPSAPMGGMGGGGMGGGGMGGGGMGGGGGRGGPIGGAPPGPAQDPGSRQQEVRLDPMASSKGMAMMQQSDMGGGRGDFGGSGGMSSHGGASSGPGGSDDGDEDEGEGGADAMGESGPVGEGMYDPSEYDSLAVSGEIKELFQYITRYKPHNIELETKMRPFIPDYIPAVGEIDAFVKVPRPDGKQDNLGLEALDEPASNQSDPTVLQLQLRAVTKSSAAQPMMVHSVESAEKDPKAVTRWINSINDLHRHKPPPSVHYSKPMPDIEALMQIWPAQFEELLETVRLPDADMQAELPELVRIVCALLDIPVYGEKLTESLHVLFSLYSDFKANVHFQQQLETAGDGMDGMDGMGMGGMGGMGGMDMSGMDGMSPMGGGEAEQMTFS